MEVRCSMMANEPITLDQLLDSPSHFSEFEIFRGSHQIRIQKLCKKKGIKKLQYLLQTYK